jgi:hypothetical protein
VCLCLVGFCFVGCSGSVVGVFKCPFCPCVFGS